MSPTINVHLLVSNWLFRTLVLNALARLVNFPQLKRQDTPCYNCVIMVLFHYKSWVIIPSTTNLPLLFIPTSNSIVPTSSTGHARYNSINYHDKHSALLDPTKKDLPSKPRKPALAPDGLSFVCLSIFTQHTLYANQNWLFLWWIGHLWWSIGLCNFS